MENNRITNYDKNNSIRLNMRSKYKIDSDNYNANIFLSVSNGFLRFSNSLNFFGKKQITYSTNFFTLFCICVCMHSSSAQSNLENLKTEVDKILKYEFSNDSNFAQGYSIAVIDGDSSWILNYGHLPYSDTLLNENAFFELSGLSKIITSSYLLYNENQEQLNLDLPLSTFYNINVLSEKIGNLSLRQLINHTTGIPKFIKNFQKTKTKNPLANISYKKLMYELNHISFKKSNQYLYSHHNYAVIQWFIEQQLKRDIKDIFNEWLEKLKVDISNFQAYHDNLTPGTSKIGKTSNAPELHTYWASMGINSNIIFMRDFIQKYVLPIHNNKIKNNSRSILKTKIDKNTFFIDGWYGLKLDKKRYIYSHAGRSRRHKVAVHMLPETSTAVIIFSNSELGTEDLGLHILRMINNNWKRK